jgi:integrase/recombinase XerD
LVYFIKGYPVYIFSLDFKPGKVLIDSRIIGREWSNIRDELKFSKTYQFYSLKDTGIVRMILDGVPLIDIRNQAGHSSLEQTNQYAKYTNPKGNEFIKKMS